MAHCKMGGRSQKAAEFLQQAGFKVRTLPAASGLERANRSQSTQILSITEAQKV